MHRRTRITAWLQSFGVAVAVAASLPAARAQQAGSAADGPGLRQAFDAAWARQPEALALPARRDAVRASQQAAQAWTPQPPALGLVNKSDRLNGDQGSREFEVGIAVPIWLAGERQHSAALADAEALAVESRSTAAQLRVAATVREAWWAWQRARIDVDTARAQLDSARRIAQDVARRHRAGDLARADQHQADGAVAAAESALAQAEAAAIAARQLMRATTGLPFDTSEGAGPAAWAAETEPADTAPGLERHATLAELKGRADVAQRAAALAAAQSRASPELLLATTRERGAYGESYQQTITLGLRLPFGGGARHEARIASARADDTELQAQLALETARLIAERESASARVAAARAQLAAAQRRAQLAAESRGFFDKSFRLGETDLPTRLRIEAEAAEAERQAARTRVDLAAAISHWRQVLGLLPQ